MRKFVVLFSVLGLVATVSAGTYTFLRGKSGVSERIIQVGVPIGGTGIDTSKTSIVDTAFSDTADVSGATIGAWVLYNVGTVNLCDSCNDSVTIFFDTYVKMNNTILGRLIKTDTMGGNNVTTLDDSTKSRYFPKDSLFGTKLYVRTRVTDAMTHAFTDTMPNTEARYLHVPTSVEVYVR